MNLGKAAPTTEQEEGRDDRDVAKGIGEHRIARERREHRKERKEVEQGDRRSVFAVRTALEQRQPHRAAEQQPLHRDRRRGREALHMRADDREHRIVQAGGDDERDREDPEPLIADQRLAAGWRRRLGPRPDPGDRL
jgi:hypothetical protein